MKKSIFLAIIFLLAAVRAYADQTIDTMIPGGALTGTEKIPMFQAGNPAVLTSPSAIGTYIAGANLFVPLSRTVNTSAPLSGGGALSSNLTLSLTGPSNLTTFTAGTIPMGAGTSALTASEITDVGSAGVVVGSATGGAKGAGTINMTGCFINNVSCAGSGTTAGNPTATIGTSAVNGSASTYMRSDGAPAIPQCSSSTFGACKVDGTTITASSGVITAATNTAANPTATIGTSAVNGSASTYMRSDAAPAISQCSSSTFGACKVDGTTITASGGVITSTGGTPANPTATIGTSAVNGSATTYMRSDGAPAIAQCSSSTFGACKVDGTTITASGGIISSIGTPANPTATIGTTAVNGSASTFMRSDGAPAAPKCSSSTFGFCEPDAQTILTNSGVLSTTMPDRSSSAASVTVVAGDMGGQINLTGTSQTVTIPAISSTVLASGMSLTIVNNGTNAATVSSSPTVNLCSSSIAVGQFDVYTSNGTSLDCFAGSNGGAGGTAGNPTATIGTSAVNGSATTFMRSDAAPAAPKCTSSTFGMCEVDNSTILAATAGVIAVNKGTSGGTFGLLNANKTDSGNNTWLGQTITPTCTLSTTTGTITPAAAPPCASSSADSIAWNQIGPLTGQATLAFPTGLVDGEGMGFIVLHGSAGNALFFANGSAGASGYIFPNLTTPQPPMTNSANAEDLVVCQAVTISGNLNMHCGTPQLAMKATTMGTRVTGALGTFVAAAGNSNSVTVSASAGQTLACFATGATFVSAADNTSAAMTTDVANGVIQGGYIGSLFHEVNLGHSVTSVTVTYTGSPGNTQVLCDVLSGVTSIVSGGSALTGFAANATTSPYSSGLVNSGEGSLVWGVNVSTTTSVTLNAGSGFTLGLSDTSGTFWNSATEWKLSTGASDASTWTNSSSTSTNNGAGVIVFQ